MRYTKELFIAVLIIALFGAVWDGQRKRRELSEFEQKDNALKTQLDSITALQNKTSLEALAALTSLNLARQELAGQRSVSTTYRKRYESLKNKPVPDLSDSAIARELSGLYPR